MGKNRKFWDSSRTIGKTIEFLKHMELGERTWNCGSPAELRERTWNCGTQAELWVKRRNYASNMELWERTENCGSQAKLWERTSYFEKHLKYGKNRILGVT